MSVNYDDSIPSPDIPPVLVKVLSDGKRPTELRVTHKTIVLTAANPVQQVTGYDPARKAVIFNVFDNAIVLSGSIGQASDPANTISPITAPNGRLLNPLNGEYSVPGPNELWVSTGTYPSKIAFSVVREI